MRQRQPAGGTNRARRVIRKRNMEWTISEPYENRTRHQALPRATPSWQRILCRTVGTDSGSALVGPVIIGGAASMIRNPAGPSKTRRDHLD